MTKEDREMLKDFDKKIKALEERVDALEKEYKALNKSLGEAYRMAYRADMWNRPIG